MAKSKDDITYGTSQARVSEDEATRVAYKHGTPLEGAKIADSETVDLFPSAHNIIDSNTITSSSASQQSVDSDQSQLQRDTNEGRGGSNTEFTTGTGAPSLPKKNKPPSLGHKFWKTSCLIK